MKRRILVALATASVAIGFSAASAHGHAPPPEHNHYLTVPGTGESVQVGPHICHLPQLHEAFHQFHSNVHLGAPNATDPVSITAILCTAGG
jgi:hypothetical protein